MTLDTTKIIRATERMLTITLRMAVTDDMDGRRKELIAAFEAMATDLGKIASSEWHPATNVAHVHDAVRRLHTEAVQADERRCGTFTHLGSKTAVLTHLHALAAHLGFILSEADTADLTPEDEIARRYAEGHETREAAE